MTTAKNLECFFKEYENIVSNGLEYNYSEKEIYNAIYKKEFNNYLRKGIHPRLDELNHTINFVRKLRSGELNHDVKSQINYYKWNSENNACHRCNELNGQIFDYLPERPHPHCNCEIVEISEEEAGKVYREYREGIRARDKASGTLQQNFLDGYGQGECAKYVASALEKGGIDIKPYKIEESKKDPKNYWKAYKYGEYLGKEGSFIKMKTGQGEIPKNYIPQIGDIVVFSDSTKRPSGHMQMFTGTEWGSDYDQSKSPRSQNEGHLGFFPHSDYKENEFTIYRNPKWIKWEIDKN